MKRYVIKLGHVYLIRESLWTETIGDAHHFLSKHVADEIALVIVGSRVVPCADTHTGDFSYVAKDECSSADYANHLCGGR